MKSKVLPDYLKFAHGTFLALISLGFLLAGCNYAGFSSKNSDPKTHGHSFTPKPR